MKKDIACICLKYMRTKNKTILTVENRSEKLTISVGVLEEEFKSIAAIHPLNILPSCITV